MLMITLIVWKRLSLLKLWSVKIIVLEQIRKLVLRIFIAYYDKRMINSLYFLDNPSKIRKNKNIHNIPNFLLRHGSWCLHPEGIHPDTPYYLHTDQGYLILWYIVIYCLIKHIKHFLLFFWSLNTWVKYVIFYEKRLYLKL